MKRAVSWCLLVLLSCVGLVACGTGPSGPSPSPPPTTPASATASPSPSAVAKPAYKPATATSKALNVPVPVMPEAAKKETPDGAKAFVGYWVAMLSYAYETGDVSKLKALHTEECITCRTVPEKIESVYEKGWIVGGQLKAERIELRSQAIPDKPILVAQIRQSRARIHIASGSGKLFSETNNGFAFQLWWTNSRWFVTDSKLIVS